MAILRVEKNAWKQLQEDVDNDIWGCGYKRVTGRLKPQTGWRQSDSRQLQIAETLFPRRREIESSDEELLVADIPLFTDIELQAAARKIKGEKAAGPDMIPPVIVKIVVEACPQSVLEAMNNLLVKGQFLREWKTTRLVLLEKKQGEFGEMIYRPLCMLNAYSKLLEHLLVDQLLSELNDKGGLADHQYGFRKGRST